MVLLMTVFCFSTIVLSAQERRVITSDSVSLYVKVKGKGIPCLYIHGGPGSGSYWMEKFAGPMLEERFQMIYLDLRGVGRSGSPSNADYGMMRMISDFEEIRKELGISQWVLMGHSFSGTLLTGYAMEKPEALMAMMMFNSTLNLEESITTSWIPESLSVLSLDEKEAFGSEMLSMHEKMNRVFGLLHEKDLVWKLAFSSPEQEARMNASFGEVPNWNGDFSSVGLSHPDYLKNFKPYTREIKLPVLYFYGTRDFTIGPNHYKGLLFPNLMLYEAEVGHVPFMDDLPEVASAIDSFMAHYKLNAQVNVREVQG